MCILSSEPTSVDAASSRTRRRLRATLREIISTKYAVCRLRVDDGCTFSIVVIYRYWYLIIIECFTRLFEHTIDKMDLRDGG